ncbi:hypothetical protein O9G_006249, partial [Rozella allomycis CSF55]
MSFLILQLVLYIIRYDYLLSYNGNILISENSAFQDSIKNETTKSFSAARGIFFGPGKPQNLNDSISFTIRGANLSSTITRIKPGDVLATQKDKSSKLNNEKFDLSNLKIQEANLSKKEKEKLTSLCERYHHLFVVDSKRPPSTSTVEHHVELTEKKIVTQASYRVSPAEREAMK